MCDDCDYLRERGECGKCEDCQEREFYYNEEEEL